MKTNYDIGYERGLLGLAPTLACNANSDLRQGYIDGAFDLGVERAQEGLALTDFEERNEHVVRGYHSAK